MDGYYIVWAMNIYLDSLKQFYHVRLACYISFSLFNDARCQNCPISNLNRLQFSDGLFLCSVRHALDYKEPPIAGNIMHMVVHSKALTSTTDSSYELLHNHGQLSSLINTAGAD